MRGKGPHVCRLFNDFIEGLTRAVACARFNAGEVRFGADFGGLKCSDAYGVLGLASTVYEEKQEYATGTAYQKVVTTKYDA